MARRVANELPGHADHVAQGVRVPLDQLREPVDAVDLARLRTQVRWLSPTWSSWTRSGVDTEPCRQIALDPDGHVAQTDGPVAVDRAGPA